MLPDLSLRSPTGAMMDDKPERRGPGRPRKIKIDAPKLGKGRPSLPLSRDPERYFLAIMQANIDAGIENGLSELSIIEAYAALRYCTPVLTNENAEKIKAHIKSTPQCADLLPFNSRDNVDALIEDTPFRVVFDLSKHGGRGYAFNSGEAGPAWDEKTVVRAYVGPLRKKVAKIRRKPPTDTGRRWLDCMSMAWRICFQGDASKTTHARQLAADVGELEYFNTAMQPVHQTIQSRIAERRNDPSLSMAEFWAILIPTTKAAF